MSVIYYKKDYDKLLPTSFHLGTYRANPLAMAAGKVVLNQIPSQLERVREKGKSLLKQFESIDSNFIGETRGKGFMVGIEMIENGKPMDVTKVFSLKQGLLQKGLMMHTCGHYGNVFRFMGALNIPDKLLDKGQEIFGKVIEGVKWNS